MKCKMWPKLCNEFILCNGRHVLYWEVRQRVHAKCTVCRNEGCTLSIDVSQKLQEIINTCCTVPIFLDHVTGKKIPPIVRHCPYSVDMPTWRCTLPAEPSPTVYLLNKHIIKLTTVLMGVHFNQRLYHSKSPAAVLTSVLSSTTQTLLLLVFKHADDLQRRPKQLALLWRPSLL